MLSLEIRIRRKKKKEMKFFTGYKFCPWNLFYYNLIFETVNIDSHKLKQYISNLYFLMVKWNVEFQLKKKNSIYSKRNVLFLVFSLANIVATVAFNLMFDF